MSQSAFCLETLVDSSHISLCRLESQVSQTPSSLLLLINCTITRLL